MNTIEKLRAKLETLKMQLECVKSEELHAMEHIAICLNDESVGVRVKHIVDSVGSKFGCCDLAQGLLTDSEQFKAFERAVLVKRDSHPVFSEFLSMLNLFRLSKIPADSVSQRLALLRGSSHLFRETELSQAVMALYTPTELDSHLRLSRTQWLLHKVHALIHDLPVLPIEEYFMSGLMAMNLRHHDPCGMCGVCYYKQLGLDDEELPYFQKSRSVLLDRVTDSGGAVIVGDQIFPEDNTEVYDRKIFLDL